MANTFERTFSTTLNGTFQDTLQPPFGTGGSLGIDNLLLEDGNDLLFEDGCYIKLEN